MSLLFFVVVFFSFSFFFKRKIRYNVNEKPGVCLFIVLMLPTGVKVDSKTLKLITHGTGLSYWPFLFR